MRGPSWLLLVHVGFFEVPGFHVRDAGLIDVSAERLGDLRRGQRRYFVFELFVVLQRAVVTGPRDQQAGEGAVLRTADQALLLPRRSSRRPLPPR